MKYHSTVGKRTFMKMLGFGRNDSGVSAAESEFHDLDEVMASPVAEWKRPWWVRSVDKPTVEIEWERMQRFDARKIQQVSHATYVGEDLRRQLKEKRADKTKDWILKNSSGYTLRDRALDTASRTGAAGSSFQGSWKESSRLGSWSGDISSPGELGVPRWNASPEENARMIRAALRHFGADHVGFVELDENTRKLVYSFDALDGKALEFKNVDTAYETEKKRVIPYKARWVIVFTVQMSEEQIKLMIGSPPTPVSSSATGLAYSRARSTIDRLQNFLHVLGYQGLMGTWYNGLGIAPAFAVMAGIGELSRINRIISPEYGAMQRVFKVITDLPLAPTKPIDAGIMRFCHTCKMCAEACPSGALSMETEPSWEVKGPWNNPGPRAYFDNGPKCYTYWWTSTASCSRCLAVCPFSTKKKSFVHKLVMSTLSVTPVTNKFFARMHTLFGYGMPRDPESWWKSNLPPYGVDTTRTTQLGEMIFRERDEDL